MAKYSILVSKILDLQSLSLLVKSFKLCTSSEAIKLARKSPIIVSDNKEDALNFYNSALLFAELKFIEELSEEESNQIKLTEAINWYKSLSLKERQMVDIIASSSGSH